MSVTLDINDQAVFTALRAFLLSFLPSGTEVVQGIDNRVPMPEAGFVVMTSLGQYRLNTNRTDYQSVAQTKAVQTHARYTVQLDFVGPSSQAWATQAQALFRDVYAAEMMPANIQPLYADDPMQIALVDGEAQYEQRWMLTASIDYAPTMTIAQQSATSLEITTKVVDMEFPA
jgi:hypothetical protein